MKNYVGLLNPNLGKWVETNQITHFPYIQYDSCINSQMIVVDVLFRPFEGNIDCKYLFCDTFDGGFILTCNGQIDTPIQLYIAFNEEDKI